MTDVTITHIGGPTALIEVGGWRILTDPTFDPPGKRYFFGWGTMSRKLVGPSILAKDLGQIDAVLVSHHHHGDNLDPQRAGAAAGVGHDVHDQEGRQEARRQHSSGLGRRGRPRPSRRRASSPSRSPRRRAATARSAATRSPAPSSASRSTGRARSTASSGSPATRSCTTDSARSPRGSRSARC